MQFRIILLVWSIKSKQTSKDSEFDFKKTFIEDYRKPVIVTC